MSKYKESEQFENYGKDSVCQGCEALKLKLIRKVGLKQNTINNLERELKGWRESHWNLVGANCKLMDKLRELGYDHKLI